MSKFWEKLKKPFLVLAPMEDVTDTVFREIVAKYLPKPNVFFTEFTNVDGLTSEGYKRVIRKFDYTENQRPIVAQIWGTKPENFLKAAKIAAKCGFDGIDVNMGCPDKSVIKIGAGAALCQNPKLAKKILEATRDGAGNLPVSIKTRLGLNKIITQEWISFLLEQKLDALTIHARTAKERSDVPAHWDEIGKAVELKNKIYPSTVLIGNGDVKSVEEAEKLAKKYTVDGIMIARGIFSNPWVFEKKKKDHLQSEYIEVLIKHIKEFEKIWGETKNYDTLKKFYKMYVNNFPKSKELRNKLMMTKNYQEALHLLTSLTGAS